MAVKLKLKIGAEAAKVEAATGFANYTGPTPPPGVYAAKIKQLQIKETKGSEDKPKKPMLVAIIEFEAPKSHDNSIYNGFAIFHRLVIPESMEEDYIDLKVGQINRLFDAISGDDKLRAVFWGGNAVLDDKGEKIIRMGKLVTSGKDFKGFPVVVSARGENYTAKKLNPKTKKVEKTVRRSLRVNDIYPGDHEVPDPITDDEDVIVEDDGDSVDDVLTETDNDEVVSDDDGDAVVDDDPEAESEPDESGTGDDDDDPTYEVPDEEDEGEYVSEDGDEDGYVAEEPEPEPEPEPKKPAAGRRRRSAF
ncbi:hypothetical protein SEA_NOSILAM_66 [Gordonia phage NosilaM]|uniref:Uncharacterized protein n=1 Tax=Gordonia phage NosilaM TaxID=2507863 RepID=A0A410TE56_9CAUD|nr:hypothetical protein KNU46_gp66 [Gordonia phage NosilaM]QAU07309.1 hypothetical protein SEA_NOSILAM_66 [Gordonia phage NosilaM]